MQGHNRYWSSETVYAKANGGPYNFHIQKAEGGKRAIAAPDDQMFWDWLLQSSKEWGLVNYEQDWYAYTEVHSRLRGSLSHLRDSPLTLM